MEWKRSQGRIERDRKERKGWIRQKKDMEHTRKCYRPTGGWAYVREVIGIVQGVSSQTSGPG